MISYSHRVACCHAIIAVERSIDILMGRLTLDGRLIPISGILSAKIHAKREEKGLIFQRKRYIDYIDKGYFNTCYRAIN